VAAFDHQIRIGADEGNVALLEGHEHVVIIFRHFLLIVEEARADDGVCLIRADHLNIQAVEQRHVALRTEEEDLPRALGDQVARHVTRGDDAVIGTVGNAQQPKLGNYAGRRPRRIGD